VIELKEIFDNWVKLIDEEYQQMRKDIVLNGFMLVLSIIYLVRHRLIFLEIKASIISCLSSDPDKKYVK